MIIAAGGSAAGYTLYVKDRRLVYEYNFFGKDRYKVTSEIKQLTLLHSSTSGRQ